MARKFKQLIYPDSTYGVSYGKSVWEEGYIFTKDGPIIQLGVQVIKLSDPKSNSYSTKLRINNSNDIQIGYTGIFELDLADISQISSLKVFPPEGNTTEKVIVDIVYEDGSDK